MSETGGKTGPSFEERLEAVQRLIVQIESGTLPLEESVKHYEEGKANELSAEAAKETEAAINKLGSIAQSDHMERMRLGLCSPNQGLSYVEALNSLSRIANHITAIAETLE